jgi:hypothetical protein
VFCDASAGIGKTFIASDRSARLSKLMRESSVLMRRWVGRDAKVVGSHARVVGSGAKAVSFDAKVDKRDAKASQI